MDTLKALLNKRLISVTFVLDYIQFDFDEVSSEMTSNSAKVTSLTHPVIISNGIELHWGMPGYCDLLCKQIESIVLDVSAIEGEAFQMRLDSDAIIRISLKPDDYCGPEAVIVNLEDGQWSVW